ncbi:hypothetical protein IT570_05415 [Candidatus Sumerlaeota bacterium]|nr:hypothetical protein [Candidatus Sumerlaeota bacterium]
MTFDILRDSTAPQPSPGHRDWYAHEALRALPRLILMVDKNQYSRTYGCFDRSFWHYRTMDFPCGMNQEFVLPLALAYKMELPHNPYLGMERLRELALAGIDYAIKGSHSDGTTDDYFPFERAMGALVFSLYAMTETCLELGDRNPKFLDFFALRGDWLLKHNETGKLANHQAFAALALYNVYLLTKNQDYLRGSNQFRDLTLSWGNPEGWFQEYEGADPGYHACLISFFAKLWQKSKDEKILKALLPAVDFAHLFMHPDGSYAGEYGSRNTFHFYPHGFEVLAPFSRKACEIADSFLHRGMPRRTRYYNDDDRMAAHYVYDWMHSWRDYHPQRTGPVELPQQREATWLPNCKVIVEKNPNYHFIANASKGGAFKALTKDGMFAGDTGLIAELEDGRVIVTHIVGRNTVKISDDKTRIDIRGVFQVRKHMLPTPFKQVLFRLFMLTVGRFNANAVRSFLQKILIVQKAPLKIHFRRQIVLDDDTIQVIDDIVNRESVRFARISWPTDATSIYVANSNVFQASTLHPWEHVSEAAIARLNGKGKVRMKRGFKPRRGISQ